MKKYLLNLFMAGCIASLCACTNYVAEPYAYPSYSKVAYFPYDGAMPTYPCCASPMNPYPSFSPVVIQAKGYSTTHYNNARYYP